MIGVIGPSYQGWEGCTVRASSLHVVISRVSVGFQRPGEAILMQFDVTSKPATYKAEYLAALIPISQAYPGTREHAFFGSRQLP